MIAERIFRSRKEKNATGLGIVAVLMILWLLGFTLHVVGSLIHLLLVVAIAVLIIDLVSGRRRAV
jgi:hypothetical protein